MYIMPSTPLTCCSIGAATVLATTSALAPGKDADTSTVGGVISGYCVTGSRTTKIPPARVMTIDSTEAKMGRLMKKRENTARPHFSFGARPEGVWGGGGAAGHHARRKRNRST